MEKRKARRRLRMILGDQAKKRQCVSPAKSKSIPVNTIPYFTPKKSEMLEIWKKILKNQRF